MFFAILARIIVGLGIAALAALIARGIFLTVKKFVDTLKEKLSTKIGGTVVASSMARVAQEAIEQAKRKGNTKKIEELEELLEKGGIAVAVADENNNIDKDDIKIYQDIDDNIYEMLDEDGMLVATA